MTNNKNPVERNHHFIIKVKSLLYYDKHTAYIFCLITIPLIKSHKLK